MDHVTIRLLNKEGEAVGKPTGVDRKVVEKWVEQGKAVIVDEAKSSKAKRTR